MYACVKYVYKCKVAPWPWPQHYQFSIGPAPIVSSFCYLMSPIVCSEQSLEKKLKNRLQLDTTIRTGHIAQYFGIKEIAFRTVACARTATENQLSAKTWTSEQQVNCIMFFFPYDISFTTTRAVLPTCTNRNGWEHTRENVAQIKIRSTKVAHLHDYANRSGKQTKLKVGARVCVRVRSKKLAACSSKRAAIFPTVSDPFG